MNTMNAIAPGVMFFFSFFSIAVNKPVETILPIFCMPGSENTAIKKFSSEPCVFNAVITERRVTHRGFLTNFNQVTINTGNAFDAATGSFTAPEDGLYHFSGWFMLVSYGCYNRQAYFDVTITENITHLLETFRLPVVEHAPVNQGEPPAYSGQRFNFLVKLRAGTTIRLKTEAITCEEENIPFVQKAIFSGFKVY